MKFKVLKVIGNSMHSTLESGAFVLVWQSKFLYEHNPILQKLPIVSRYLSFAKPLKVGDIVVVNHPKYGQIIKRVVKLDYNIESLSGLEGAQVDPSYQLVGLRLRGDHQTGTVSEAQMGWVQIRDVIGKVIYVFKK